MRSRSLLVLVLCLGLLRPAAATPPAQSRSAATWLAARVTSGGYVTGLDGAPDLTDTVVIGIALGAAGVAPKTLDAIATYLSKHVDTYATYQGKDRPGALGRLAMLATVAGRDPRTFGGTDLVARILATRTLAGPYAGLLADPLYNGTFNHALGLLGVATATPTAAQQADVTAALDFLAAQQCDDGGFQNAPRVTVLNTALSACGSGANGPDTNAASLAAQALSAFHRMPRLDPLPWWDAAQNTAGGWGYQPGATTDADSTALAIQAILASGASPTAARFTAGKTTAYAALLALQLTCAAAPADRGAFVYQRGATARPNLYATAEAIPAVARLTFPLHRPSAWVTRAPLTCTTHHR